MIVQSVNLLLLYYLDTDIVDSYYISMQALMLMS